MAKNNEYEIGGISVRMTSAQAARWNSADFTAKDMLTAMVGIPDRYTQSSYIQDGEVVMGGVRLAELSRSVPMIEADEETRRQMEDCHANLLRKDVA